MKKYNIYLRSICLVLAILFCVELGAFTVFAVGETDLEMNSEIVYASGQVITDELLEIMGLSYFDIMSGNYDHNSNEKYSCVIWIEDIDMEPIVRAGIDAAEATRSEAIMYTVYDYPYETYTVNGHKFVEVDLDVAETDTYVQTYIDTKREEASSEYIVQNEAFVQEYFESTDTSIVYISKYSPCVFAELTVNEMVQILYSEVIDYIGYWDIDGGENASTSESFKASEEADLAVHVELIRADEARSVYGVTGSGVKIGQYEQACPRDASVICNPSFPNINVGGVGDFHADCVHTIMTSVAPSATYYASGRFADNDTDVESNSYVEHIEWLLSQGVNIINLSFSLGGVSTTYSEQARWLDHIAYNHDVHVVCASGNNGTGSVPSSSMAYNVITVGNTIQTSPYTLHSTSGYNGTSTYAFKPDVVAPGTYASTGRSGTSFSTPLVTGTIALMCQYQPALKTKQHVVKAILAATTGKNSRKHVTSEADFQMYGAGIVDARSALWAVNVGNYAGTGTVSSSSTTVDYYMTVTSSDTLMRVALAYANRIKFSGSSHTGTPNESGSVGILVLYVYSPSGTQVASCTVNRANLKVVEFDPRPYGTGTYTIRVTQTNSASGGRVTNFGVAWR